MQPALTQSVPKGGYALSKRAIRMTRPAPDVSRWAAISIQNQVSVMNLHGTNVVIIVGSSGMGLATAKLLKEQGANVTIASRSGEKLQQAARQIGDVRAVVADVRRMGLVEEVAQAVVLLMTNGFTTGEVLHIDGGGRLV